MMKKIFTQENEFTVVTFRDRCFQCDRGIVDIDGSGCFNAWCELVVTCDTAYDLDDNHGDYLAFIPRKSAHMPLLRSLISKVTRCTSEGIESENGRVIYVRTPDAEDLIYLLMQIGVTQRHSKPRLANIQPL